jgi:hypothetical protein
LRSAIVRGLYDHGKRNLGARYAGIVLLQPV